jgi:ketosteroid isomerase-like protein
MRPSLAFLLLLPVLACHQTPARDLIAEKAAITQTIHHSISWALTKDKNRLLNSVAHDSSFFIYHPTTTSTIIGYPAFENLVEKFFMRDEFRATGYKIKNLRVTLSHTADVAWFSALLDDFGTWKDQPTDWVNCRWTGVLEKRQGKWIIVQMHFSFGTDQTTAAKPD